MSWNHGTTVHGLSLLLAALLTAQAYGSAPGAASLTGKDERSLADKIAKSLRRCKGLPRKAEVDVEVHDASGESVDEERLAGTITSLLEGKTDVSNRAAPDYNVTATLEATSQTVHRMARVRYTLHAEVTQAGETLCRKSVSLVKTGHLSANE